MPFDHERTYRHGWRPTDFEGLDHNLLVLEPLRRPERLGGLVTAGDDPRFEALAFRVLAHGEWVDTVVEGRKVRANRLSVGVGDVVTIRNALSEPVQPDRKVVIVDVDYVWAVVERAGEAELRASAEATRQADAKRALEAERQAMVAAARQADAEAATEGEDTKPIRVTF